MAISSSSTSHPLDPLSGDEMLAASELIRAAFKGKHPGAPLEALIFNVVTLDEPSKSELLAFDAGKGPLPARKSFSILQPPLSVYGENERYAIVEVIVNLDSKEVEQWNLVPGVQPLITPEDCFEAEKICKADAKVCAMLAERYGITNVEVDVACDPWSVHEHGDLQGRLVQLFLYKRVGSPNDNQYSHPIDMVPVVCLEKGVVVHIDASETPQKINEVTNNYHQGKSMEGLKPVNHTYILPSSLGLY